jgi:hypothetical protein
MNKYSTMPKDDLALELEKLQGHYEFFQRAERNWRCLKEYRLRKINEHELKQVHEEIARRKRLGRFALALLEKKNKWARTIRRLRAWLNR